MIRRAHTSEQPLALVIIKKRFSISIFLLLGFLIFFIVWSYPGTNRQGYYPDEELTFFSVEGITRTGFPFMPSGVLYDRGLPYSYLCWIAGKIFGDSFWTYRMASLVAVVLAIIAIYGLTFSISPKNSPILAAALMAGSVWISMIAQWARFYSLFILFYLFSIIIYLYVRRKNAGEWLFLLSFLIAMLLHIFAVTLVALPLFYWLLEKNKYDYIKNGRLVLVSSALIVAVQAIFYLSRKVNINQVFGVVSGLKDILIWKTIAIPNLNIINLSTSIYFYFSIFFYILLMAFLLKKIKVDLFLLTLFTIFSSIFQLGILFLILLVTIIVRPVAVRSTIIAALVSGFGSMIFWTAQTIIYTDAAFSYDLTVSLMQYGINYPLDAFRYVFLNWPITIKILIIFAILGSKLSSEAVRFLSFLIICQLSFLGIMDAGYSPRYFIIFFLLSFILISISVPATINANFGKFKKSATIIIFSFVFLCGSIEHWRFANISLPEGEKISISSIFRYQFRSTHYKKWINKVKEIKSLETVVCNDVLACMLIGIKPNYFLFDDETTANRFIVEKNGVRREIYTGAVVINSNDILNKALNFAPNHSLLLANIDTGKFSTSRLERIQNTNYDRQYTKEDLFIDDGIKLTKLKLRN